MTAMAAVLTFRKPDVRGELADARMELVAHKAESLTFIRRVKGDANAVVRLIEGGRLVEAHSVAGGLVHLAGRREVQLTAPDDGDAA